LRLGRAPARGPHRARRFAGLPGQLLPGRLSRQPRRSHARPPGAESACGATVFSFDIGDGKPPKQAAAGAGAAKPAAAPAKADALAAAPGEHTAAMTAAWAEAVAVAGKR